MQSKHADVDKAAEKHIWETIWKICMCSVLDNLKSYN